LLAATAGVLSLGIAVTAAQAQEYVLKFNHVLGAKEPYHKGFQNWAKAVEEKTGGKMKIEVFHSAQLGVEEDIIEQIRQGANIGQNTDSARMGNYVPGLAIMNGPYFAENLEDVKKLQKSPTIIKWQQELADKFGIKVLSFNWVQGYRHFFTNKPIKKPEDLKGLRIRTPPAPIWQESVRALGAEPVAIAFTDIYPALQQKAVDGAELVYNNIMAARMYEVMKYGSDTGHIMLINFQVISAKFFNSLPADIQKILVEECDKAGEAVSKEILANEKVVKEELKKKGMTFVDAKDIDLAAFRTWGKNAYKALKIMDAYNTVSKEIGK
jgi:tripartite ATP-independent transporter DctP family solute receptor